MPLFFLVVTAVYNAKKEFHEPEPTALGSASVIARQAAAKLDEHFDEIDQFLSAVAEVARHALERGDDVDPRLKRMRAAGWLTTFAVVGEPQPSDTGAETVCYGVVQDALNNAARHADAASVSARLEQSDNEMNVHSEDDGCGFGLAAAPARVREGVGMGLLGRQERVRLAGGSFHIETAPTQGRRVDAVTPVAAVTP